MKIILSIVLLILVLPFFLISNNLYAKENCENRYVTLINPVRGRNLWIDKSIKPLRDQYNLVSKYNFPATWLIQYDVLSDMQLLDEIKKFNSSQELGVFLEVSQKYATDSRVIYPFFTAWFSPKTVFLSGYSQSDRRKLIDKLFAQFNSKFGIYPKSVGSWWIDSYSLNYMKHKYNITAALIVADQKTTDNYGVWGQWWGMPYYPSKSNILTPASNLDNKEKVVILQWAQRDPVLAYGEGWGYSNYSLQANDYKRMGKDTTFFKELVNVYHDCKNPIGQISVGLETGMESVGYLGEYENQLKYLSIQPNLNIVTMSQFAKSFSKIFPEFPKQFEINSDWILKTDSRKNLKLGDDIKYHQDIAFKDFFISDRQDFLNRNLEQLNSRSKQIYFPFYLPLIFAICLFSLYKKLIKVWMIGTLFVYLAFGLILKSHYQFGWEIFYGPKIPFLIYIQIFLVLISYLVIYLLSKIKFIKQNSLILWFIPLSFGLDYITSLLRFSSFDEKYFFGITLDSLRFVGFSFNKLSIEFVNKDFPSSIASALLRFDFNKIWDSLFLSLIVYPALHIVVGVGLGYLVSKVPCKARSFLIIVIVILTTLYLINIFQADPRLVQ